jgi:hypothetical protein
LGSVKPLHRYAYSPFLLYLLSFVNISGPRTELQRLCKRCLLLQHGCFCAYHFSSSHGVRRYLHLASYSGSQEPSEDKMYTREKSPWYHREYTPVLHSGSCSGPIYFGLSSMYHGLLRLALRQFESRSTSMPLKYFQILLRIEQHCIKHVR